MATLTQDHQYAREAAAHIDESIDAADNGELQTAAYHYAVAAVIAARQSHELADVADDPFWADEISDPKAAAAKYQSAAYAAARAAITWTRHPESDSSFATAAAKERAASKALSPFKIWH